MVALWLLIGLVAIVGGFALGVLLAILTS